MFYLARQFLSHPGPDQNHMCLMHRLYLRHQVMLAFTVVTSKYDATLCKSDVNVKNRTAAAGIEDLFEIE